MAKVIKSKASGIEIGNEEPIAATENVNDTEGTDENLATEDNSQVDINADIIQKAPVKFVRILPKRDHTCVIGGERYTLRAGTCMNVPLEVKNILTKADLLSPL